MSFGELIRELLTHLYGLWPLRIVRDWEQGVRLRLGNATASLNSANGLFKTGLHAFWPVLGEIIGQSTNIQTPETDRQDLETVDGKRVSFSLAVRYRVRDLRLLYLKIHDQDDTVLEEVRSAAAYVAQRGLLNQVTGSDFGENVLAQVKKQTHGWGLEFLSVTPVNMTTAQQLRLIQDPQFTTG